MMRRGTHDVEFLYDSNEQFVGVNLGWDFTAEHEWGLKGLSYKLGFQEKPTREDYGFEARKVTKFPAGLRYQVSGGVGFLSLSNLWHDEKEELSYMKKNVFYSKHKDLQAAWSGSDFAVRSKEHKAFLKELFEAFQNLNVVVFLSGRSDGVFSNAGLKICIADRIPEEANEAAKKDDLDRLDLQDAVDKTGILERVKKAGKRYYACSPRWSGAVEGGKESSHPVVFWLNPADQRDNNYGWFTVEELDQWIEGKGPIPKG